MTATRRFDTGEKSLGADVDFRCQAEDKGLPTPTDLSFALTTYDQGSAKSDQVPPAKMDLRSIQYRIDAIGSGTLPEMYTTEYDNRYRLRFALIRAALLDQTGIYRLGPLGSASIDNTARQALAADTENFKWTFQTLALKFKATTSVGTSEQTIEVPLNDPNVIKVAHACGWSETPKSVVVAASTPANAPTSGPSDTAAANSDAPSAEAQDAGFQGDQPAPDKTPTSTTIVAGRPANCRIELGGKLEYEGACQFQGLGGGSFAVSKATGDIIQATDAVVVRISSPDHATMTLNHSSGAGHDDVGELVRSGTDRACWSGMTGTDSAGAKVCVR